MKIRELFETSAHYDTTDTIEYWQEKGWAAKWDFEINADGSVNIKPQNLQINSNMLDENGSFALKMNKANAITITSAAFANFKNFCSRLETKDNTQFSFRIRSVTCPKLKSLEGCPTEFGGDVDFGNAVNLSLANVHKHIKSIETGCYVPNNYKGPLLGFLKIKNIKWIDTLANTRGNDRTPLGIACAIISKYLETDRNIVACQEELFKNNLDEFAKL